MAAARARATGAGRPRNGRSACNRRRIGPARPNPEPTSGCRLRWLVGSQRQQCCPGHRPPRQCSRLLG
eukprot:3729899-Lingulodinium_polyedra.AAC.1